MGAILFVLILNAIPVNSNTNNVIVSFEPQFPEKFF